ncbi:hypothetical protein KRR26_24275 [Corallococcus sp. M34]|uniref:hypothetical protein n=1 Tax=Citreicoccus inhibens TaxID=2849499 RepID=UPI001C231BDE|nr:hypothetical protein [Citreicoccus inhibens]MBU8898731.1 hypothetical protein [Citreicoccus inhibens]
MCLFFGVFALISLDVAFQVLALMLNAIQWRAHWKEPPPTGRWKPLVGMGLAVLGAGFPDLVQVVFRVLG